MTLAWNWLGVTVVSVVLLLSILALGAPVKIAHGSELVFAGVVILFGFQTRVNILA